MSDFEDSYHPVIDTDRAQLLVVRAGRDGIVLPERSPYTCVLVDQPEGGIDTRLLSANTGLLVRYEYGEDHGVWIKLFRATTVLTELALEWGPDFLDTRLPRGRFDPAPWMAAGLLDDDGAAALARLATGMREGSSAEAGHQAARLIGLTRFEGLSCDPSNVKRGPWNRVEQRALARYPDAIVIETAPS